MEGRGVPKLSKREEKERMLGKKKYRDSLPLEECDKFHSYWQNVK